MVVQAIGVGARKIVGVRMISARILPHLPEKLHKKVNYKKKFFMLFWAPWGAIFAHIFRRLLSFSRILLRFSEIFPRFPRIFSGFSPSQNCSFVPPPPTPVVQHKIGVLR